MNHGADNPTAMSQEPDAGRSAAQFYDQLADSYDKAFPSWHASVDRQASILDSLIRHELGNGAWRVLDCMCGIGTQALGLARRGHDVTGTDISGEAIRRAAKEATKWRVDLKLIVADVRSLEETVEGTFDVAVTCDNSVSYLLEDEDLAKAFSSIAGRLADGALLMVGLRDYDRHLLTRPAVTVPTVTNEDNRRRISFQTWDWDGDSYEASWILLEESEDGFSTDTFTGSRCRAYRRDDVAKVANDSGFTDVRWLMPADSGYHQPLMLARKSSGSI